MGARDPQTGQFISTGSAGAAGFEYRDHEIVHYRGTMRDNGLGPNAATTIQDVTEIDPPADRRQEEAELVALLVHVARAETDEAVITDADSGGLRAGFEWSRDEDPGTSTDNRTQVDLSNSAFEGDAPVNALSRQVTLDDMDPLAFIHLRAGYEVGGVAWPAVRGPFLYNYRGLLGGGPVFTGGDTLHLHGRVNLVSHEENWVADTSFTTYWAVRERD